MFGVLLRPRSFFLCHFSIYLFSPSPFLHAGRITVPAGLNVIQLPPNGAFCNFTVVQNQKRGQIRNLGIKKTSKEYTGQEGHDQPVISNWTFRIKVRDCPAVHPPQLVFISQTDLRNNYWIYSCGHKNFVWETLNFTSHLCADSKQHVCVQLINAQRFFTIVQSLIYIPHSLKIFIFLSSSTYAAKMFI